MAPKKEAKSGKTVKAAPKKAAAKPKVDPSKLIGPFVLYSGNQMISRAAKFDRDSELVFYPGGDESGVSGYLDGAVLRLSEDVNHIS